MCSNQKKRRRLISELMQGNEMESKPDEEFFVKSNAEFTDRQRNIFAGLAGLEAKHNEFQVKSAKEIKNLEVKLQAEQEVVEFDFPVPSKLPARRKNNPMPAYARQPRKWTKYSLADVDNEQLSEKSNTQAALSFLELVRKTENTETDDSDKEKKILFSKSGAVGDATEENKIKFSGGKWRMPEYNVGQTSEKRKRSDSKLPQEHKTNKTCKVELSHLDDDDDGDDDGEENKTQCEDSNEKFSSVGKAKRILRKVVCEDD